MSRTLCSLTQFPISMAAVTSPARDDEFLDMNWIVDEASGLIRIEERVPPESLYAHQTTRSATGQTWRDHHSLFATYISNRAPSSVLEIGGAHGYLAKVYCDQFPVPWVIVEPSPAPVEECPAVFIADFFGPQTIVQPEDLLVHSHLLEHMHNPGEFLSLVRKMMVEGQEMVFSIPHLELWVRRRYSNALNFEHSVFLTLPHVRAMLGAAGLSILDETPVLDGHSVFFHVRKGEPYRVPLDKGLAERNEKTFVEYIDFHRHFVTHVSSLLAENDNPAFIFGAHVFAQFLLAFGLPEERFHGILDNDPEKQGKRLYGTGLMVSPVTILNDFPDSLVVLHAGAYNEEIKRGIEESVKSPPRFLAADVM